MHSVKLSLVIVGAFLVSCISEGDAPDTRPSRTEPSERGSEPKVYDPHLNAYVPSSFYDHEFEWANDSLIDLKAPSGPALAVPGGMISDSVQVIAGPPGTNEVYKYAPPGSVLTGVGALISSSSNNYTSLVLEYRYLSASGSLGTRFRVWSGTNLQPYQLEAWYAVPDGKIVWGVCFGGKYDVKKMDVWYRTIDFSTFRLSGSSDVGVSGLNPYNTSCTVQYLGDEWGEEYVDRAVVLGLGLTSTNGGTTHMVVDVGYIQ
jgi:hypothetical protein